MKIYVNPGDHIIVEIGGQRVEIICGPQGSGGYTYIVGGGGGGTITATGGGGGGYAKNRRTTDK